MRTNLRNLFSLSLMAAAVAACGGGGDGGGGNQQPQSVTGKAIDFYLSGATVTFTDCGNQTATTDSQGNFTFPAGCAASALTVKGGVDIGTNLPFNGVLQAPKATATGTTPVVTPLTTLVAQLGPDQAAALATKLGLSGKNLLTLDPMQDAGVLQASVAVQQLLDQVANTLSALSTSDAGGTLTPEQASAAAVKALADSINAGSGTFNVADAGNVKNVVQSAVVNAASGMPPSVQNSLSDAAANVAAVSAATIAGKVGEVQTAMSNVTIGSSPAATLSQLGSKLDTIAQSTTSPAVSNLISTIGADVLTAANAATSLSQLGSAVASGVVNDISTALTAVGEVVGGAVGESLANIADALQNINTYSNYLQIGDVKLNNGAAVGIDTVIASADATKPVAVSGGALSDVQVALTAQGSPFGAAAPNVRAGLTYTVNGNTVTVTIDEVDLTFNGSGVLTGATVPAGASYSFSVAGAATASASLTNAGADNLFSNGNLDLSVTSFLSKLKSASPAAAGQIAAYTPKTGDTVTVSVVLGAKTTNSLNVGTGTGASAKAAAPVTVGAVSGLGIRNATLKVNN